jgi:hypothetical protein
MKFMTGLQGNFHLGMKETARAMVVVFVADFDASLKTGDRRAGDLGIGDPGQAIA